MTPTDVKPIAVALEYTLGDRRLPRVTASGKGPVAERILALAAEHGIPIRQDPELAKILSVVELDSEIPPEAVIVMAEIIGQLIALNRRAAGPPRP